MFKPAGQADFPKLEQDVLEFWKNDNTFEKSVKARKGGKEFVFYDGPPFATGLPHYGHLLAGTIKDVVPRYQTMRGRYCERSFGWDCHGLPVEYEMEKAGVRAIRSEGVRERRWAVLDYGDVIVHIFNDESRLFYHLEKLWDDGENVEKF